MSEIWIGIDPGVSGAIAAIMPDNQVVFYDTPVFKVKSGKTTKSEYDAASICHILQGAMNIGQCSVTIERQQSMPDQGVSSTFRTGFGFGLWLGILSAIKVRHTIVAPVSWKKKMMADMGKEKSASILRATQLFPGAANDLRLVKHHGRADALLICEYGRRLATATNA